MAVIWSGRKKKDINKIKYRLMKYYKNNGIFGQGGKNTASIKLNTGR